MSGSLCTVGHHRMGCIECIRNSRELGASGKLGSVIDGESKPVLVVEGDRCRDTSRKCRADHGVEHTEGRLHVLGLAEERRTAGCRIIDRQLYGMCSIGYRLSRRGINKQSLEADRAGYL